MVSLSFSIDLERLKKIQEIHETEELMAGRTLPLSRTVTLLVQRGIAYTEALRLQAEENKKK